MFFRVTAETYMHGHSSRSHAIVTVCYTQVSGGSNYTPVYYFKVQKYIFQIPDLKSGNFCYMDSFIGPINFVQIQIILVLYILESSV